MANKTTNTPKDNNNNPDDRKTSMNDDLLLTPRQAMFDLFGDNEIPAVGLLRIPMKGDDKEGADHNGDADQEETDDTGVNFHLETNRKLAKTWLQRGQDNVAAIELLREIESEKRHATPDEQAKLVKFCAFSSTELAQRVFGDGNPSKGWAALIARLNECATPQEQKKLRRATQYAHYTPEYIVEALWSAVQRFGFEKGQIIEPGCGTGLFIAKAPKQIADQSYFVGIENDNITARIAKLLYPRHMIMEQDYAATRFPASFDLAIGNPPFSKRTERFRGKTSLQLSLHDYFITKSLAALKPGGIAAFVVSRWTMDKGGTDARENIHDTCQLLGAIRLPRTAMREDAGTDVIVDLLFFRKRLPGENREQMDWLDTEMAIPATESEDALHINEYFIKHPEMVLGTHERVTSAFGLVYSCKALDSDLKADLIRAVGKLPQKVYENDPDYDPADSKNVIALYLKSNDTTSVLREGSYFVKRNRLHQIIDGHEREITIKRSETKTGGIPKQNGHIINGMIAIRDAARAVLSAQQKNEPWQQQQVKLRIAYMSFTRQFGAINRTEITRVTDPETDLVRNIVRRPNIAAFADDPDVYLVASIENYDQDLNRGKPGPLFSERVIYDEIEPEINDPTDALVLSLNKKGAVDLSFMADMLNEPEEKIIEQLGTAIYYDPKLQKWVTDDEYLSGRVRRKLAFVQTLAAENPIYQRNVEALEKVLPTNLGPSEISARIGATWIPGKVIEDFTLEVIGVSSRIKHIPEVGTWTLETKNFNTVACQADWGTTRYSAQSALGDALNSRIPQIYDTVYVDGKATRIFNPQETESAKEKVAKIKNHFEDWVWKDTDRGLELAEIYNRVMNDLVPRHFNGSHLKLQSASSTIVFHEHQKRATWRIISDGSTYIAHAVGAGKTFTIVAAIMEQRRLGLINKALLTVPAHCLAQVSCEFLMLYPTAKILVADETNFEKSKRKRFIARAATENWDCIIITHSAFMFIPVDPDFEAMMIEQQIDELTKLIAEMDSQDRISVKKVEQMKEAFIKKLEGISTAKDDLLTIGEMGIDQIIVDEAQQFRKLSFSTNMSTLKGIDPQGSARAWDLYIKIRYTETHNPKRAIIESSGTPITNTMAELYTLQKIFAYDILRDMKIQMFDSWATNYGDSATELELQPSGTYKAVTRFSNFVNVPELIDIFRSFADIVLKKDLGPLLKIPAIKTGARQLITAEPSEDFKDYQRALDYRIKSIQERKGAPKKGDDILLSVITDGRHAAIDMRLVARYLPSEPGNKLNLLIDNVANIYWETSNTVYYQSDNVPYANKGAGQMIFSDLGTNSVAGKRGFSAYAWIKSQLIKKGIPEREIVFMQDYKKANEKRRIISNFNAGQIRIIIGSTDTLGTGVNGQLRLIALHHLDVPWLPSSIEQREGRIERQGNQNQTISIFAYATKTSMDATMWQTNERKQKFIEAALSGDRSVRKLEDLGAQSNQFAMAKAIASGDTRLIQKAGLETEIARLARKRHAHLDAQYHLRHNIQHRYRQIERCENRIKSIMIDKETKRSTRGDLFEMDINGSIFTERKKAGTAIIKLLTEREFGKDRPVKGKIGGFPFKIKVEPKTAIFDSYISASLKTDGTTEDITFDFDITPLGLIARLESTANKVETDHKPYLQEIENLKQQINDSQNRITDGFDLQPELDNKQDQLYELEKSMAATADPHEKQKTESEDKNTPAPNISRFLKYGRKTPVANNDTKTIDDPESSEKNTDTDDNTDDNTDDDTDPDTETEKDTDTDDED